ncbi:hypothetical protein SeLEV6574_g08216 [Synchytrium endobioticum]|uniref:Exosome complex component RRP4 n=1 Tax=Synchytrium endobioticum TaxID=286115 RepID=A0A507C7N6_9FUNG|nr:hypothetical protein SeLEV6574_g08216 [Synchytrium endobioticum]
MDMHDPPHASSSSMPTGIQIVTPGETITKDPAYMRGHGTYMDHDKLVASAAGIVERVNKLISVRPLRARYNPQIGDIVVGRVTEVQSKRWKVDIGASLDAGLLLSSITLPGGVQRRKSESDELQMRSFIAEGDLVCAEVQQFFNDGSASLHTRSTKYGKLRTGTLVVVSASLIKRSKSHFVVLQCGVDVVLGVNGFIWICKHAEASDEMYSNTNEAITGEMRTTIARLANCVVALCKHRHYISDSVLAHALAAALAHTPSASALLHASAAAAVVAGVRHRLELASDH